MVSRCKKTVFFLFAIASMPAWPAEVSHGIDKEASLPYWQVANTAMSIRLVQRLPDQTRGYFLARGFSAADAELIAQNCVFQSVFKNLTSAEKGSPLRYDLSEWQIEFEGRPVKLKTREDWQPVWQQRNVKRSAAIAFEWSLLPTRQTYQSGDYNWGMTLYGLPPAAVFNLEIVWYQHGKRSSQKIRNLQCAPDIHPQPEG